MPRGRLWLETHIGKRDLPCDVVLVASFFLLLGDFKVSADPSSIWFGISERGHLSNWKEEKFMSRRVRHRGACGEISAGRRCGRPR
jgi:hypothetical protein